MQVDIEGAKIFLLGWQTNGRNLLQLLVDEARNKWVLKHKADGIVKKAAFKAPVVPGEVYDVKIIFDGNQFLLYVNGSMILSLPKASTEPFGILGFKVKSTTGTLVSARMRWIEVTP